MFSSLWNTGTIIGIQIHWHKNTIDFKTNTENWASDGQDLWPEPFLSWSMAGVLFLLLFFFSLSQTPSLSLSVSVSLPRFNVVRISFYLSKVFKFWPPFTFPITMTWSMTTLLLTGNSFSHRLPGSPLVAYHSTVPFSSIMDPVQPHVGLWHCCAINPSGLPCSQRGCAFSPLQCNFPYSAAGPSTSHSDLAPPVSLLCCKRTGTLSSESRISQTSPLLTGYFGWKILCYRGLFCIPLASIR